MKLVSALVDKCITRGYITQGQAPWLYYGIEKRLTTILISIPMLIIGSLVSTPAIAIAFYVSFYLLRSRTNGLHAKTLLGCLIHSILSEVFFLGVLSYILDEAIASFLLILSAISIFYLAPYNHHNMGLSVEEAMACAKSAKRRLAMLILLLIALYLMQLNQFSTGILLGIVMTAVMLVFAYILKGEKSNEKTGS